MSAEDRTVRSPWVSVWFSPRPAIACSAAIQPTYIIGALLVLGIAATLYNQIVLAGIASDLQDWRLAFGLVFTSVVFGIISFYVGAWILNVFARLLGGGGSVTQTRAACAWSVLPTILSSVVILALGASTNHAGLPGVTELLVIVFSLWSFIVFLQMLGRVQDFGVWRAFLAGLLNLLFTLFIAVFVRSFLYQSFSIPSGSMRPTLLVGDYIFVSKSTYGYSHFSLPFSPPLFSGRILFSPPAPGDVVVFRHAKDTAADYVKRVIGLPGDRIQMQQGRLHINEAPVKRERMADVDDDGACGPPSGASVKHWRETLPNGASYETLDCLDNGFFDNTVVFTVPEGHFFVLGDNRDNSIDSRVSQFGPVPFENLIGRVGLVYYSRQAGDAGMAAHVRVERIGMTVR